MDKLKTFTVNDDLDSYLSSLESQGVISEETSDALYETYKNGSLTGNKWTVVDDGGFNWLGGIDRNAKVAYGSKENGSYAEYTLAELKKKLKAEGMSGSEANDYIKKLQKQLGIG